VDAHLRRMGGINNYINYRSKGWKKGKYE
jgi:hypothetical protein